MIKSLDKFGIQNIFIWHKGNLNFKVKTTLKMHIWVKSIHLKSTIVAD